MKIRMILGVIAVLLAITLSAFEAEAQSWQLATEPTYPDFPVVQGRFYKFEKVAEGVYYAVGDSGLGLGSNHTIVVNEDDVLLVDDAFTPVATRELLQDLKIITDKPVRYVVNTHWHFDHTGGNQVFGPEVAIIGSEYTRTALLTFNALNREPFLRDQRRNAALIGSLQKQIVEEQDASRKEVLKRHLAEAQLIREERKRIKPTPPDVTFISKMVLYDGTREIDLLFLGRGHTGGDIVVYLPKERIVCTGDLVESLIPYQGDAFFGDWIATLGNLKKLDFTLVLPGHGRAFEGKGLITAFQGYLTDLMNQVRILHKRGLSPQEAAKRVDLTAYEKFFSNIHGPGARLSGVERLYEQMDQEGLR